MTAQELIDRYGKMIYRIAMNYLRNTFDAEDVYGEVFLRYYRHKRFFATEEHQKAWLIRVAINCSKNQLKQRGNFSDIDEIPLKSEENCGQTENALDVHDAIETLSPEDKTLIYLFYYEQMKIEQIADEMDLSEDAVKKRLERSRKKLKIVLSADTGV